MRVIINADDFGLDSSRNHAISEAFNRGLCSQTSLIVNTAGCDEAVAISKKMGFFNNVCLHLNLTVGCPITDKIRYLPEFCSNGIFNGKFHHSTITRFSKGNSDIVKDELKAQIVSFLEYGFPMRHIDSHHWVQLDRKIAGVMHDLILQYGFRSIRKGENIKPIQDIQIILQKKTYLHLSHYISLYNNLLSKRDLITADYVGKIQNVGKYSNDIFSSSHPEDVVEFITHPIYKEGILYDKGVGPLADMIGPLLKDGHSFITYNDLR